MIFALQSSSSVTWVR